MRSLKEMWATYVATSAKVWALLSSNARRDDRPYSL